MICNLAAAAILLGGSPAGAAPNLAVARTSIAALEGAPDEALLDRALFGFSRAWSRHEATRPVLAIVDYARPSTERRLWVLDLASGTILFHELVAHGKGSGENFATAFSDAPGSLASSVGAFRAGGTYQGKHGYSLVLQGLEPGFNASAERRDIVMHGASYVSDTFVKAQGRLGRSWGCPAVNESIATPVIEALKNGAMIFADGPDPRWREKSEYLKRDP